jgi:hypothetical protein
MWFNKKKDDYNPTGPKVRSSVYPNESISFNEWHVFLYKERMKISNCTDTDKRAEALMEYLK